MKIKQEIEVFWNYRGLILFNFQEWNVLNDFSEADKVFYCAV